MLKIRQLKGLQVEVGEVEVLGHHGKTVKIPHGASGRVTGEEGIAIFHDPRGHWRFECGIEVELESGKASYNGPVVVPIRHIMTEDLPDWLIRTT